MELITLADITEALQGELYVKGSVCSFNKVSTDTRKIEPESIFIALKGDNFNGNDYVETASEKGAALCIVDEIKFDAENLKPELSVLKVVDTRKALLDLAEFYKSKLNIKVIGITGSTGKTSTKDMTYAILKEKFKVYKTQGNFNNEVGLPLTIFNLDKSYDIAVLEMGMSHFGEIHKMAKAARPDIALITNIGMSHIENLKTRENILKAKLEITDYFSSSNTLVINSDNDILSAFKEAPKGCSIIKTGTKEPADIVAENIVLKEDNISFDIYEGKKLVFKAFKINVPGKHNVQNALLSIAAGKLMGVNYNEMQKGIEKLDRTSMRLDIVKGDKFTIIDDCYNASPDSMKAAIDVLKNMKGKRKIAVLGSMREIGERSYSVHREIGEYAKENSLDILITIGEFSDAYKDGFSSSENFYSFDNSEEIIRFLKEFIEKDDIILVKASRAMKLEEIVKQLKDYNN